LVGGEEHLPVHHVDPAKERRRGQKKQGQRGGEDWCL